MKWLPALVLSDRKEIQMWNEMSPQERGTRAAILLAWVAIGYWAGGWWGAASMWAIFIVGYWVFCLANGIVQGIKRMTGPKVVVDNRTLNMDVHTGSTIKGTPVTVVHKDPTRPDRELTS